MPNIAGTSKDKSNSRAPTSTKSTESNPANMGARQLARLCRENESDANLQKSRCLAPRLFTRETTPEMKMKESMPEEDGVEPTPEENGAEKPLAAATLEVE